jgi:hypothetical protein
MLAKLTLLCAFKNAFFSFLNRLDISILSSLHLYNMIHICRLTDLFMYIK